MNENFYEKRRNCPYRHENGNCLPVGGFCTAVADKHCPMKNEKGNGNVREKRGKTMNTSNLIGQKFGKLLVIGKTDMRDKCGHVIWKCQCDCGKVILASTNAINSGRKKSCGCAHSGRKPEDLSGQEFGHLKVLCRAEKRSKSGEILWLCRCDCGKEVVYTRKKLKNGHAKSCGCKQHEIKNDLAGRKFGKLTALRIVSRNPVVWECRCECGNTVNVWAERLMSGNTQSCGCLVSGRKTEDLSGRKFGKLTAVRLVKQPGKRGGWWECHCSCGGTCIVRADSLKSGNTKSCGCLRREVQGKKIRNG